MIKRKGEKERRDKKGKKIKCEKEMSTSIFLF